MIKQELSPGMVVQLSPECRNPMLACCMMTITEPKPWGAQGYVQCTGVDEKMGGQAYYRAQWGEMELVGDAVWSVGIGAEK